MCSENTIKLTNYLCILSVQSSDADAYATYRLCIYRSTLNRNLSIVYKSWASESRLISISDSTIPFPSFYEKARWRSMPSIPLSEKSPLSSIHDFGGTPQVRHRSRSASLCFPEALAQEHEPRIVFLPGSRVKDKGWRLGLGLKLEIGIGIGIGIG
jgi:hypothetical protein